MIIKAVLASALTPPSRSIRRIFLPQKCRRLFSSAKTCSLFWISVVGTACYRELKVHCQAQKVRLTRCWRCRTRRRWARRRTSCTARSCWRTLASSLSQDPASDRCPFPSAPISFNQGNVGLGGTSLLGPAKCPFGEKMAARSASVWLVPHLDGTNTRDLRSLVVVPYVPLTQVVSI